MDATAIRVFIFLIHIHGDDCERFLSFSQEWSAVRPDRAKRCSALPNSSGEVSLERQRWSQGQRRASPSLLLILFLSVVLVFQTDGSDGSGVHHTAGSSMPPKNNVSNAGSLLNRTERRGGAPRVCAARCLSHTDTIHLRPQSIFPREEKKADWMDEWLQMIINAKNSHLEDLLPFTSLHFLRRPWFRYVCPVEVESGDQWRDVSFKCVEGRRAD